MNIAERLRENAALVDATLAAIHHRTDPDHGRELDAERYSLFARAKRIRPTLVLEFCRLFGGRDEAALPFAAAVEMVHTYSLIHDDLPCMDNDDMRRGRPTCHKAFDEATALLAGDGLLTGAFGALTTAPVAAARIADAVAALARAAGNFGMIGGQVMDLAAEGKQVSLEYLWKLHALKTGALMSVSAELGCIAAGLHRDDPRTAVAMQYAERIGLVFQIVDDILDATSDAETLGKSVGSDEKSNKTTFLTFFEVQEAKAYAASVTEEAKAALRNIRGNEILLALADHLTDRKY